MAAFNHIVKCMVSSVAGSFILAGMVGCNCGCNDAGSGSSDSVTETSQQQPPPDVAVDDSRSSGEQSFNLSDDEGGSRVSVAKSPDDATGWVFVIPESGPVRLQVMKGNRSLMRKNNAQPTSIFRPNSTDRWDLIEHGAEIQEIIYGSRDE